MASNKRSDDLHKHLDNLTAEWSRVNKNDTTHKNAYPYTAIHCEKRGGVRGGEVGQLAT